MTRVRLKKSSVSASAIQTAPASPRYVSMGKTASVTVLCMWFCTNSITAASGAGMPVRVIGFTYLSVESGLLRAAGTASVPQIYVLRQP